MSAVLQIGDKVLTAEQALPLLTKYRLVPQLARELLIEEAIADYSATEDERLEACKRFYQQNQISSEQDLELWLQQQRLTREDFANLIDRELQLNKFKIAKWEHQVESYFCQRKSQIDQVVFSMVRVKDLDVAEEIYFRLVSKESSFAELAPRYSDGMEAKTKGISGPVELGKIDPVLAGALAASKPEEVLPPTNISGWWVVMQLETIIAAQLDDGTRHRLIEELFTIWVQEEVKKLLSRPVDRASQPRTILQPTL
jgi:parvulin-like peptidyl-prolyl isomerase